MKKHGFTLAEVLITLAIIGVVATITLPALMSNTQEQQAVTAFRKSMNTLNEVAQMNAAVDGFDYGGITAATRPTAADVYDRNGRLNQSVWGMMASKAQVDATKSGRAGAASAISPGGDCANLSFVIAFRDGTTLCYANTQTADSATAVINATVDTNGLKAPNLVSTCDNANCSNKAGKVIRDQFQITLYNGMAIPGRVEVTANGGFSDVAESANQNNASRWALSK